MNETSSSPMSTTKKQSSSSTSSPPLPKPSTLSLETNILETIYNILPVESLKDVPNIVTFWIAMIAYLIIFFAFLYSVIYGYKILREEKFLSLTKTAGSCNSVSKIVDSEFMADINGNWEGQANFEYRSAIYSGNLNNFNGNEVKFDEILSTAFEVIDKVVGQSSYSLDLAENLVIWMAASIRVYSNNQVHSLHFTGDPKIVFNGQYIFSALSNEEGNCDVAPSITYDRSVGVFTISYPLDKYLASSKCMSIVDPNHFGYIGYGPDFTFRIDMQSAITAIGVNTGVIKLEELEVVPNTENSFVSSGILYHANHYFYPRYPGMTPLQCVNSSSDQIICALSYGSVYAYPIFNHLGASYTTPIYCDCETEIGHSRNCNYFNFLPGMLFYDFSTDDSTGYGDLVSLITNTSGRKLNRMAYNASADGIMKNQSSPEWRKEAFKFCTVGTTRGCSILTIATSNPPLSTVSPYYYQVPYGSCNNSYSISKEAQNKLLTTPPTPLSEIYYECTRSQYDSFMSAAGVAVGNSVIIRNLLIVLIASLFVIYHRTYPLFFTYTHREKEKVLHFLAFNLLLARDGLYPPPLETEAVTEEAVEKGKGNPSPSSGNQGNQSIIKTLQLELSNHINVRRFYHNFQNQEDEGGGCDVAEKTLSELEMNEMKRNSTSDKRVSSLLRLSRASSSSSSSSSAAAAAVTAAIHLSNKDNVINPLSSSSSSS